MKYKLKFKALDMQLSTEELKDKTIRFLQEKYQEYRYDIEPMKHDPNIFYFTLHIGDGYNDADFDFLIDVANKDISKSLERSENWINFDKDELEFMYEHGFKIDKQQARENNQSLEDWF